LNRTARWIALLLFVLGIGALLYFRSRKGAKRLNVLLITLDTTRADHLGCMGAPGDITPNFDALARDGTAFRQCISTAAVTPVSHASILTGLDNREHRVRFLSALCGFRLPKDVPTLATVLHDAGYATGAVHSAFPVSAYYGFERGFDVFEDFDGSILPSQAGTMSWDLVHLQRRSDTTTGMVLDQLARSERPFFMWVHYWDPHDNVLVPPRNFLTPDVAVAPDGSLPPSRALYAAEVHYTDYEFGRLIEQLKASGEYDNTLIVVVADHGEGLGDHGWEYHRILYQEQIHVPLIVRVPGEQQAAASTDVVRTTDIFPTVLDYLGLEAPRAVSGRSLRALIEGRADTPRLAFADQINGYDLNAKMIEQRPFDDFVYAVIEGPHKLVYRPKHPERSELFDLGRDPRELVNLYANERELARKLEKRLAEHASWVLAPCMESEDQGMDRAQAVRMLTILGYVESTDKGIDVSWQFVCPDHPSERSDEPDTCPLCSGAMLLVKR
jgi:arylsulfatase A-like enzyme